MPLEVDPVIPNPESMQDSPGALKLSEIIHFGLHDLPGKAAKFAEDLELKFFWHACQLSGAGRIEDYLKWTHGLDGNGSAYGNRTRLSALRGPCPEPIDERATRLPEMLVVTVQKSTAS